MAKDTFIYSLLLFIFINITLLLFGVILPMVVSTNKIPIYFITIIVTTIFLPIISLIVYLSLKLWKSLQI